MNKIIWNPLQHIETDTKHASYLTYRSIVRSLEAIQGIIKEEYLEDFIEYVNQFKRKAMDEQSDKFIELMEMVAEDESLTPKEMAEKLGKSELWVRKMLG